jgi:TatD DNase family protein
VTYLDAHNHLHDVRLEPTRSNWLPALARLPLTAAVVNGTREDDWDAISRFAGEHSWVIPSYGIHPWYVADRTAAWLQRLREILVDNPAAAVGEIGLDRWVEGHNLEEQLSVFRPQLALAVELNRPATIHCIRAWGALWDIIRECEVPERGFLLHSYGGPAEMVDGFVARGAWFSFSPYFLHERKAHQRETFEAIPRERILAETDAPDMRPPDAQNPRPLQGPEGDPINHPANIDVAYTGLAETLNLDLPSLGSLVAENFARLFAGVPH